MDNPNFLKHFMTNHEQNSQLVHGHHYAEVRVRKNSTIASIENNYYSHNNQKTIGSTYIASTSSQQLLSFGGKRDDVMGSSNVSQAIKWDHVVDKSAKCSRRSVATNIRASPEHGRDHILAERRRREKLSQRLIALAAIVPGLKKTDKASILEDATNYVKQLQVRVKKLEEGNQNKSIESVVLIRKSQLTAEDIVSPTSSTTSTFSITCNKKFEGKTFKDTKLPDIKVKVSDRMVLVRIQCQKHKGIFVKVLEEMEKLHLEVMNSSLIPFGSALDTTIVSQMEDGYCMDAKLVVEKLNSALTN